MALLGRCLPLGTSGGIRQSRTKVFLHFPSSSLRGSQHFSFLLFGSSAELGVNESRTTLVYSHFDSQGFNFGAPFGDVPERGLSFVAAASRSHTTFVSHCDSPRGFAANLVLGGNRVLSLGRVLVTLVSQIGRPIIHELLNCSGYNIWAHASWTRRVPRM